jgi:WD40 repeat protein
LKAGKPVRRFVTDHHRSFTNPGLAFSPDGRHLGYVQSGDFACVWDVKSGKQVAEYVGGGRHQTLCQFTPDGKNFILGDDKRLIFWDLRANKEARSIPGQDVFLLTPDARFGIRFSDNRALLFSDARSSEETGRLDVVTKHNGIENGVAFAPDSKKLAVVHRNKEIQVRAFPDGKLLFSAPLPNSAKLPSPNENYCEYQLSFADSQTLLLGTSGGLVHRWDLATGKELSPLKRHFGAVSGVHMSPDGKTIVTTGADGLIRRWDRQTGRELSEPAGYMGRTHAVYSPDGRCVVIGDARGRLEVWDARNGRSLRVLQREGPAITKLAVTAREQRLAVARADNTVHLWKLPAGEEPRILHCDKEHNLAHMWTMRFSPDGRRLLIADGNYRARLWELASGEVRWRARFGSAVFSPDGKTLAMVFHGPYLNLLDASSGKPRAQLRQSTNVAEGLGRVPAMASSPDGQRLALGVNGVFLCDARTGAVIHHFQAADWPKASPPEERRRARLASEGGVHGLAFSPDGKWLGTSGIDGSVRLWEGATGQEVLRLNGHAGDVKQIAFGADSRTILSCGEDSQAYLWSLRPPMEKEGKPSLNSLWAALAGEPAKAYRAIWALSEAKDAAAFLRDKLAPVKPVTEERLQKLIADLESETFAVRESATKALAELGENAAPAMRKTLTSKPPLETRKRLEDLIQRIEAKTLTTEELRTWRALDVLERIGTPEVRQVLKALADGAPGARLTEAAKAALKRLQR